MGCNNSNYCCDQLKLPIGDTGDTGPQGPPGDDGDPGKDGEDGSDGTTVLYTMIGDITLSSTGSWNNLDSYTLPSNTLDTKHDKLRIITIYDLTPKRGETREIAVNLESLDSDYVNYSIPKNDDGVYRVRIETYLHRVEHEKIYVDTRIWAGGQSSNYNFKNLNIHTEKYTLTQTADKIINSSFDNDDISIIAAGKTSTNGNSATGDISLRHFTIDKLLI